MHETNATALSSAPSLERFPAAVAGQTRRAGTAVLVDVSLRKCAGTDHCVTVPSLMRFAGRNPEHGPLVRYRDNGAARIRAREDLPRGRGGTPARAETLGLLDTAESPM
jgi:hypothetical protein